MTRRPWLIGLCGHARSGKDTVAKMIAEALGHTRIIAFADPLKKICHDVFDFTDEQLYGDKRDEGDPRYPRADGSLLTPRFALQTLGTEWGRNCYEPVWVEYGLRSASYSRTKVGLSVVITDVRFQNEVDAVRAAGGFVWKINRPSAKGKVGVAGHPSEAAIDAMVCATVIDNDSTLEKLRQQVRALLSSP